MIRFFVLVLLVIQNLAQIPNKNGFELHIVHLNDFHARFLEVGRIGSVCKADCIGGFSRTYVAIKRELNRRPSSIVLNAGDSFQGTLWYNIHKWNVTQHFLNMIPTDAYTLGNHEFDDAIKGVVPFIKELNAPVVVANIDDSQEPEFQNIYNKSIVIERDGKRIGIVGVVLSTIDTITHSEKLKFLDESKSVNQEAERLAAEENVDTIIVLSHCGYDVDQKIAKLASPKIGLIVGAHTHTFLYTGEDYPGVEHPSGPYPTIVEHADGRKILVVQASAYTKFLGNITVRYDDNGDVISWTGEPIYLDNDIPQDDAINADLEVWKENVDKYGNVLIGSTDVFLNGITCKLQECNLGSFIADSMVYAYLKTNEENAWTNASIALLNAGGVRSSIEDGNITFYNLIDVMPLENYLVIGEIQGKYLRESLEFAAGHFTNGTMVSTLNILQVSGLQLVYNTTKVPGTRLESVKARCRICKDPTYYEDLDDEKFYRIVSNSYLFNGGDGFRSIADNVINTHVGSRDIDIFEKYIKFKSPITQKLEGRITILTEESF